MYTFGIHNITESLENFVSRKATTYDFLSDFPMKAV